MLELIHNSLSYAWDIAEPIIGFSGVGILLYYSLKLFFARRRKYSNRGSQRFIVALQIGRPVAEAVRSHFNELDALIDIQTVLKKDTLETDRDYKRMASEVYKALAQNQDAEIHLVISGPVGLNVLIGQLIGLHHFDITVYQYDNTVKGYVALPLPDRNWLHH